MSSQEPSVCVEPLGYQPVEFLDVPPMSETRMLHAGVEPGAQDGAEDQLLETTRFVPHHRDRVDRPGVGLDPDRTALDVPIPVGGR